MGTLALALGCFVGFIVAYYTYGRWLSRKIFGLDARRIVPSVAINDGVDYVPTRVEVLFGHHFTSIAGTGPIVGPAIAIMWGWVPAVLWVVFGSIFIGAVHDFGALVVSIRNRGQTLGEVAGRLINPRARLLFLLVLFLCLLIVVAIFGLVIASIFTMFPVTVIPVWLQLPLAVGIGWWTYRRKGHLFWPAMMVLAVMYFTIWLGGYFDQFKVVSAFLTSIPIWAWVVILLIYSYIASVLPVTTLLQPRDYINSHQLIVAMALLIIGIAVAAFFGTGGQSLSIVAPAFDAHPPGAPPIWPFLFITIACGAVSGFHSLVSSGTSSKQLAKEPDAQVVGYGSMLTEGALAIMVICAVAAGIGLGSPLEIGNATDAGFTPGSAVLVDNQGATHTAHRLADGTTQLGEGEQAMALPVGKAQQLAGGTVTVRDNEGRDLALTGQLAWRTQYNDWGKAKGLSSTVGAFVYGAGNFLRSIGIPPGMAVAIMGVLVACFASTTLDTATRLQRYVVSELATTIHLKPLAGKHAATLIAVGSAAVMALLPPPGAIKAFLAGNPGASMLAAWNAKAGSGGLVLWPLFGASNQLLAGLAFMVIAFYLRRRGKPVWFIVLPAILMLVMPAWAMALQVRDFLNSPAGPQWHLVIVGVGVLVLEAWMIVEGLLMWRRARGTLEPEQLISDLADDAEPAKTTPPDYVETNP